MESVYEELDLAKDELEKLKAQYKSKAESFENLRNAYNDQEAKFKEVTARVEQVAQELSVKSDEVFLAKKMHEELQSRLQEKEAFIRQLSITTDRLRADCNEKLRRYEEENKALACALDEATAKHIHEELQSRLQEKEALVRHLTSANDKIRAESGSKLRRYEEENQVLARALDEANAKNKENDQQIQSLKDEVQGLMHGLSVSKMKFSAAEKSAETFKELRQRDDMILKVEEGSRKLEDQLKWKKEQFNHLEEAHEKLKHEIKLRKREWDKERAAMIDEISSLQTNLDSQCRIAKDLQTKLLMCNQALAHEESKRKYLEVQLSESKTYLDNVCSEYDEARTKIQSLTEQRDKEIASLRNSLGTRDTTYKEMEYQVRMLEQEKQELMSSLKELQEARIQEAGSSSTMSKLRSRLRGLEQAHRNCSSDLQFREAEWSSQVEKLTQELQNHSSELKSKEAFINELQLQLEACHSLTLQLTLENQETSLMLLVLKTEFSETQKQIADLLADLDSKGNDKEECISLLKEQLRMKDNDLLRAQKDIDVERGKVAMLSTQVESLISNQKLPSEEEVNRLKEMLKESSTSQSVLKEQILHMKGEMENLRIALDRANEELADKFREGNETEFELQIWRSIYEQLKMNLEGKHELRKEVEASLLAQVDVEINLREEKENLVHVLKDKNKQIDELEKQVVLLNEELQSRETSRNHPHADRENLYGSESRASEIATERRMSEFFLDEIDSWEREWLKKELEAAILTQIEAEKNYEQEKEGLQLLVEERDERINDLQQLVQSLEQEFESSTSSFLSKLVEMQAEIKVFHEAWEKNKTTQVLKEFEIQEKNMIIDEMEVELSDFKHNLEQLQTLLSSSASEKKAVETKLEERELQLSASHAVMEKVITTEVLKEFEIQEKNLIIVETAMEFSDLKQNLEQLQTLLTSSASAKEAMETKLEETRATMEKLMDEKRKTEEQVIKLSMEKEKLLSSVAGVAGKINQLSAEDIQLMESLERMVKSLDSDAVITDLRSQDEFFNPIKENLDINLSPLAKNSFRSIHDERSPLRSLNN